MPDGRIAEVTSGISGGEKWMAIWRNAGSKGTHRLRSKDLPVRDKKEEAEKDLAEYANKKGWPIVGVSFNL